MIICKLCKVTCLSKEGARGDQRLTNCHDIFLTLPEWKALKEVGPMSLYMEFFLWMASLSELAS